MADLGLSYAEWQLNRPAESRDAFERGREHAKGVTAGERQRITLRGLELDAIANPRDPSRLAAYRRALDEAWRAIAGRKLWLLRGMAEAPTPGDLERAAPRDRCGSTASACHSADSMPAHHYLTHACESAGRIDEALEHGRTFALLAPAVPHAHHMYGHNLRRKGRIDESIAEFQAAYDLDVAYARREAIPIEYDWHHQHNLDLLATSFQYVGQVNSAERLFRESFAIASPMIVQEFAKREWPGFLIDRGRWDEAFAAAGTMIAHPSPIVGATGHILAGARPARGTVCRGGRRGAAPRLLRPSRRRRPGRTAVRGTAGRVLPENRSAGKGARCSTASTKARAQPGPDQWSQALTLTASHAGGRRDWAFAGIAQMLGHDPSYAGALRARARGRSSGDRPSARFTLAEKYWKERTRICRTIQLRRWLSPRLYPCHLHPLVPATSLASRTGCVRPISIVCLSVGYQRTPQPRLEGMTCRSAAEATSWRSFVEGLWHGRSH